MYMYVCCDVCCDVYICIYVYVGVGKEEECANMSGDPEFTHAMAVSWRRLAVDLLNVRGVRCMERAGDREELPEDDDSAAEVDPCVGSTPIMRSPIFMPFLERARSASVLVWYLCVCVSLLMLLKQSWCWSLFCAVTPHSSSGVGATPAGFGFSSNLSFSSALSPPPSHTSQRGGSSSRLDSSPARSPFTSRWLISRLPLL